MVQIMIYIYLGVCVSMILFNCVYLALCRHSAGRDACWMPEVRSQALLTRRQLRRLRKSEALAELEAALDACPVEAEGFLLKNREGLLKLGACYRGQRGSGRAYYDHFSCKFALTVPQPAGAERPSAPREVAAG
ncbi:MAG: hypothetical protein PUB51_07705 [Oscillospiraceae bacterium]|nr:hypothetical protein [Oscillospiraceae bacterium]